MRIILSLCLLIKHFVYAWMSFFSSFLHMIFCMPNYFSLCCHLHFTQSSSFSLLPVITHNIIVIDILSYWNLFDLTCRWKLSKEIGGLRARTTPWFFGHFWKCSEVVDNYFWRLSKMAEKSRGRSCSEPFNYPHRLTADRNPE